ncbi:carboxymuconolactone decarboxylase family protein [Geodermatophilus sp. DSM 45219]|uniref:carboxymuconolactone decarboxylase family protein n=1 Tax=Geodermatophilus sp. DSM 45219 TaxID=1881103 RepID=UPI00088CF791|nr:carboxymuconolactone decarboxylase family protein [Geodermatophilus sp. DSM 45219]SDN56303.1 Alkylhydroperoxidase family enzyme, contains CxxC motif [Geodermatophilus sp. DSM 45219]
MARLPDAEPTGEVVDRVRARRGGTLTPLDRMLLHSEPLADGWNTLLGAVRSRFELAADLRELAICRVAVLNDADYEWRAHAPLLVRAGFPEEQLDALRDDGDLTVLSATHRCVVAYTDAMTRAVRVPEALFGDVRALLGDRATVELTATIGAYNMVSRFLVALEVGGDEH